MALLKKPLLLYALGLFTAAMLLLLGLRFWGAMTLGEKEIAAPAPVARKAGDPRLADLAELPPPTMEGAQKSADLVRRYPFDPRVRYLRFLYHVSRREYEAAESQIDLALATEDILNKQTPDAALPNRYVFAVFLDSRGRADEARAIAWPVCTGTQEKLAPLREKLRDAALCSGS